MPLPRGAELSDALIGDASFLLDVPLVTASEYASIEDRCRQVLETERATFVFQGEAIVVLEAAARGLGRPGVAALNLVHGPYGGFFGQWLSEAGAQVEDLVVPFDQAIGPELVEAALDRLRPCGGDQRRTRRGRHRRQERPGCDSQDSQIQERSDRGRRGGLRGGGAAPHRRLGPGSRGDRPPQGTGRAIWGNDGGGRPPRLGIARLASLALARFGVVVAGLEGHVGGDRSFLLPFRTQPSRDKGTRCLHRQGGAGRYGEGDRPPPCGRGGGTGGAVPPRPPGLARPSEAASVATLVRPPAEGSHALVTAAVANLPQGLALISVAPPPLANEAIRVNHTGLLANLGAVSSAVEALANGMRTLGHDADLGAALAVAGETWSASEAGDLGY